LSDSSRCELLNTFQIKEIEEAIKMLKSKVSCRPDEIPPYIIKGCAEILKYPYMFY